MLFRSSVEVLQSAGHLCNVLRSLPLRESVLATEMLVEFTLAGKFEDKEDTFAVVEVTKELKDVGMSQVALNLNLASNLLFDSALHQLALMHNL